MFEKRIEFEALTCPPKVVPMFKLGYGKTIKETEYVVSTTVRNRSSIN